MRQDMPKVLLEIGRTRSRMRYRSSVDYVDGEAIGPMRESMRAPYHIGWRNKESRLSIRPLLRFLDSRVGRPWDAVYSELRNTLKGRNGEDALSRVMGYVAVSTFMDEGVVKLSTEHSGIREAAQWCDYYVHPESRTLLKSSQRVCARRNYKSWRETREAQVFARRRDIDANTQAHLVNGTWFAVKLRDLPPLKYYTHLTQPSPYGRQVWGVTSVRDPRFVDDVLIGSVSDYGRHKFRDHYGRMVYGVSKRQLSHKELVKLGLAT